MDRFYALVHLTDKEPGEKLALLQGCLQGDAKFRISGLGGGESAYQQALLRLKQAYGRRVVMRAALRTALKELAIPYNDPIGFERYANRARTYLFDLHRVGETGVMDIIDGLCSRLKLGGRLAWHTEKRELTRRGRVDLNDFGVWLCDRAAANQTDEDVAAAQRAAFNRARNSNQKSVASNQPGGSRPEAQGRIHTSSTQPPAGGGRRERRRPYCFKCEGDHRLIACDVFKNLQVDDRLKFIGEHALCQSCFGVRHVA